MTYNQLIVNNFFKYFDKYEDQFYDNINKDHADVSVCYEGLSLRIMEGHNVKVIHPPVANGMYDDESTEYILCITQYSDNFVNRIGDSQYVAIAVKECEVRLFTYTLVEKDGKIIKNFMERFRDGTIKNYGTLKKDTFGSICANLYSVIKFNKIV